MTTLRAVLREMEFQHYSYDQKKEYALDAYPCWLEENSYIRLVKVQGIQDFSSNITAQEVWVPAAKRANEVYLQKLFIKLFKPLTRLSKLNPRFFDHSSFLTLTSDKKKSEEENLSLLSRHWNQFLVELKRKLNRKVRYFRVIEISDSGSIHYHILLVHIPFVSQKWLSSVWNRIHGAKIVDIRAVRNPERAVSYIIKYLKKGLDNIDMMAQLWFMRIRQWSCSRDFMIEILDQIFHCAKTDCLLDLSLTNSNNLIVFLEYIDDVDDDEVPPHTQRREYELNAQEIKLLRTTKSVELLKAIVAQLAKQWFPRITPELVLQLGSQ